MKVLFTMTFAERSGGAENMLWAFLRRSAETRIEPLVVFMDDGPFVDEVRALGLPTTVVRPGRLRQARRFAITTLELRRLILAERPALLVHWLTKAQLYGGVAAAMSGMRRRTLWWQHLITPRDSLDRAATLLPAVAIGTSSEAAAAAQSGLRPRRPVFTVRPGIEIPTIEPDDVVDRLRDGLGIPADTVVIGVVGRLQPLKGQHRLIQALAELRTMGIDGHGLVVGGTAHGLSPDYGPSLERLARSLGVSVTFTGQVPSSTPYIQLMDVLVSTCASEAFGLTLLEAMALRVPVVAVDAPGPREITDHGRTGVLVERPDARSMASALKRVIGDVALLRRVTADAYDRVVDAFGADRMCGELERQLLSLGSGELSGRVPTGMPGADPQPGARA